MEAELGELSKLQDKQAIELWAKRLSVENAAGLFYQIADNPKAYQDKVLPLLAGIHLHAFIAMLSIGNDELIRFFKKYTREEIFLHRLTEASEEVSKGVDSLSLATEQLWNSSLGSDKESIEDFAKKCTLLKQHSNSLLETVQHFLEFVWGSERPDLVERLSRIKEGMLRLNQYLEELPAQFKNERERIFKAPNDAPATEALAEIGFLYPEELQELAKKLGFKEGGNVQEYLNQTLQQKGLATVGDFKKEGICSRPLLLKKLNLV